MSSSGRPGTARRRRCFRTWTKPSPPEITFALLNLISNGLYAANKRKMQIGDETFEPILSAAIEWVTIPAMHEARSGPNHPRTMNSARTVPSESTICPK